MFYCANLNKMQLLDEDSKESAKNYKLFAF